MIFSTSNSMYGSGSLVDDVSHSPSLTIVFVFLEIDGNRKVKINFTSHLAVISRKSCDPMSDSQEMSMIDEHSTSDISCRLFRKDDSLPWKLAKLRSTFQNQSKNYSTEKRMKHTCYGP
jgi:hypothetical protein